MAKKTIELDEELYDAVQELKTVFSEIVGEDIKDDEEVIGILISGFVESLNEEDDAKEEKGTCGCSH